MSTQYAFGKIVTDGLVLSLDAADRNSYVGSGTVWNDLSGNGYTGTLTNGPTFSSANGGSIVFDGSDDTFSTVAFKTATAGSNVNNNTTNEVWYKWNGINQARLMVFVGDPTVGGYLGYYINDGSTSGTVGNKVSVIFGGSTLNGLDTGIKYGTLISNRWTQLVITRSTTTTILYQDGINVGSTTRSIINYTATSAYQCQTFAGNLALCRLYQKVLSQTEILQNYNAQKSRFGLT